MSSQTVIVFAMSLIASLAFISYSESAYAETYSDPDYNFTLDYPTGWQGTDQITESENQKSLLVLYDNSDYWNSMFEVVLVEDNTIDFTQPEKWILKEMVSYVIHACNAMQTGDFGCTNFHLISSNAIEINNRNAFQIKYSSNHGSDKYIIVFTIVSGDGRYWGLTSMTLQDNYVWLSKDIDSMIESFNFEKLKTTLQESQIISTRNIEPVTIVENNIIQESVIEQVVLEQSTVPLIYQNEKYGFSILQLDGWTYDDEEFSYDDGSYSVMMFYDDEDFYISFIEIKLMANPIPVNTSDEVIFNRIVNFLETNCNLFTTDLTGYTCSNFKELMTQTISVDGKKAYQFKLSWTQDYLDESYENISIMTIIPNDDMMWIIESETILENYPEYENQLQQVVASFKIQESLKNKNYQTTDLSEDETNFLVDLIIGTMDPIFDLVFNIQDNDRLAEWGMEIIQRQVGTTEDQIIGQLGYDPRVTCC